MGRLKTSKQTTTDADRIRGEWLARLTDLVDQVEAWGRELDWSTRRIEKPMDDGELGEYSAPGLLLQKEFTRILLEPLGHSAPGADGVVDLYLMPAYDDVATLLYIDGRWRVHYAPGDPAKTDTKPFTQAAFEKVVAGLTANAA